MQIFVNPDTREYGKLIARPQGGKAAVEQKVISILDAVLKEGDEALLRLTSEIDGITLASVFVPLDEVLLAEQNIDPKLRDAISIAARNIETFHTAQLGKEIDIETMPGVRCVQRSVPIRRVGLYIPGGSAPLFSTVLMLAIPARIAGCKEIILCTPPDKNGKIPPVILYTAAISGVSKIYRVGGAQAIGAMAYGTLSIPAVDKIFGPGNQYVTTAKQIVSQQTAIDMPAGPSEVLVMADHTANPAFVAADLLSQAEHGADSQVILLASSRAFAQQVKIEVDRQLHTLSRRDTATRALDNSRIIVMDDQAEMILFANRYAAEHLIISMENPWNIAAQITAAGSIFLGNYTPESAGDYASGTNHTLPTYGWARSHSGVNIDSFMRKITIQEITPQGLQSIGGVIETMAQAEGLDAHKMAVTIRLNEL